VNLRAPARIAGCLTGREEMVDAAAGLSIIDEERRAQVVYRNVVRKANGQEIGPSSIKLRRCGCKCQVNPSD
jgi:hypothetical protein